MKYVFRLLFVTFFSVFSFTYASAQAQWLNAEAEKLYYKGRDLLANGQLEQAVATYQEALGLAPEKMIIQRDLGKAYYFSKNYNAALAALDNVINSKDADDQAYQLMADCLQAKGENKSARSTLLKGIEQFPNSGLLYHELGKFYDNDDDVPDAMEAWLDGIHNAPEYHVNYYEAARCYANTSKVLWVILYGEIFVNLEPETERSYEVRKMIVAAYKKLFSANVAYLNELRDLYRTPTSNFERSVYNTYVKYNMLVADKITTENMIMLRTRFLMDWFTHSAEQYPFSLFSYQQELIGNGDFDVYNQWLLGRAINEQEYNWWIKDHADAMEHFRRTRESHPLKPRSSDFYNDKEVGRLFGKKKH